MSRFRTSRYSEAMEAMGLHDQGGVPDLYLPAGAEAGLWFRVREA